MMFRRFFAVAALTLAVAAAVPAMGQVSSANAPPSASQQAGKAVNKIRNDMSKLQGDMAHPGEGPERHYGQAGVVQVVAAKKAAETNAEAARRTILATLRTKEDYKKLSKDRDDAASVVTASNAPNSQVSDDDAKKAGDAMVSAGLAMKKMEMDGALKDDPKYTEASAQLDSINAKMKELDGATDLALKDDKDYQDSQTKLDTLKTQLAAAQVQLANAHKSDEAAREQAARSRQNGGGLSNSGR